MVRHSLCALMLLASCAATAPDPAVASAPAAKRKLSNSPDDIENQVEEAELAIDALLEGGLPQRLHDVWNGWNRTLAARRDLTDANNQESPGPPS